MEFAEPRARSPVSPASMTDRERNDPGIALMLAFQAGDESAFDRIVEQFSPVVYGLLTRFLGLSSRREDLAQETFLRVLRARERYQPTARFSTWLYRIVFNLCVNERERRGGRETSMEELGPRTGEEHAPDWADTEAPAPWEAMERADVVEAVQEAIAALPERQRMALVLARYEGQSFAEIADVMDTSERAIKSLVHRARENLRERLQPFLQGELA